MITGKYTGDGNATQAITGLGDQPDVLLVKEDGSGTAWIATSTMPAGEAKLLTDIDYGPKSGMISSFDSDGFTVANTGGNSNDVGVTYYYVAWDADADVDVGSFTPASTGVVSVNVGYQPAMVWLLGGAEAWDEKSPGQYLMDGQDNGAVFQFNNGGELTTASYQVLDFIDSDGFDTRSATSSGTHNGPGVGITYHYVTFKNGSDVDVGTYVGNNGTAKNVSVGVELDFVMVKNTAGGDNSWFKTGDMDATESFKFTGAASTLNITGFSTSPNEFSVGSSGEVNGSNSYDYYAGKSLFALPIELYSFKGSKEDNGNLLTWVTLSEINSSHYIIERSFDGESFEEVGLVMAAGNSTEKLDYSFMDYDRSEENNYYRLKQVDFDGTHNYHKVIVVNGTSGNTLSRVISYPSQVASSLNVGFTGIGSETTIEIFDMRGKLYKTINVSAFDGYQDITIDVGELPTSVYNIKLIEGQSIRFSRFNKL